MKMKSANIDVTTNVLTISPPMFRHQVTKYTIPIKKKKNGQIVKILQNLRKTSQKKFAGIVDFFTLAVDYCHKTQAQSFPIMLFTHCLSMGPMAVSISSFVW